MHVRLLTDLAELDYVWDEWGELYRTAGRSPFQNPELCRIWWLHRGLKQGWSPLLALGRQNNELVAVAPLAVKRARLLRVLEWAGVAAFDYPGVLTAPGADEGRLWQEVRRSNRFDVARLRWVRSDAAQHQSLAGFAHKVGPTQFTHAINLAYPNPHAWFASLPKSMRAEHREKLRLLEKRGPVVMRRITQPDDIRRAVQALICFKAEWSRSRGTETAYLSEGITDYFQDLAQAAARDETLHLTTLEAGGDVLAAHLGFVSQDGLYYYVSSYDTTAAKLSPGRVHMNMLVMWAIEQGLQRFDFLRGDADYKTRLGTTSRPLEDFMFSRGLLGSVALQTFWWQRRRRLRGNDTAAAPAMPVAAFGGADA